MKTCTNCGKVHNRRTIECLSCYRKAFTPILYTCESCNKEYYYTAKGCASTKKCNSCIISLRRKRKKQNLLTIVGTSCYICGYNRCTRALQFHHLNPKDKNFEISQSLTKSDEKLFKEIEKTIVLCANCHAELHDGLINLDYILKG